MGGPEGDIVHLTPVTLLSGRFSSSAHSSVRAACGLVAALCWDHGDSLWTSVRAGLGSQDPSHPQLEASNWVSLSPTLWATPWGQGQCGGGQPD